MITFVFRLAFFLPLFGILRVNGDVGSILRKKGSTSVVKSHGEFTYTVGEVVVSYASTGLGSTTSFTVQPFSDSIPTVFNHQPNSLDALVWYGQQQNGTGFMTLKTDAKGNLMGSFSDATYSYALISPGNRKYKVEAIETASVPPESDPIDPESLRDRNLRDESELGLQIGTDLIDNERSMQTVFYIDMLVIYTRLAMCRRAFEVLGTVDYPCNSTYSYLIEELIDMAIIKTNLAFELSGINNLRVRLVKKQLDPTDFEAPDVPNGFGYTLSRLRTKNDGVLEYVHDLRDQVGADIVTLIADSNYLCGQAFSYRFTGNGEFAFDVVNWRCLLNLLTFSHELGHLLGCKHDRGSEGCDQRACPGYDYGYIDPNYAFRDIMGLREACNACPSALRYSNDDFLYEGKPIGITNVADCAREISTNGPYVAQYRESANLFPTPAPVALGSGEACVFDFECASGICYKTIQVCK